MPFSIYWVDGPLILYIHIQRCVSLFDPLSATDPKCCLHPYRLRDPSRGFGESGNQMKPWIGTPLNSRPSRNICVYIYICTHTHTHPRARARFILHPPEDLELRRALGWAFLHQQKDYLGIHCSTGLSC